MRKTDCSGVWAGAAGKLSGQHLSGRAGCAHADTGPAALPDFEPMQGAGSVLSKWEGVCWAMQEDSLAEFLPMLKQAQLCYQSAEEFIWESEPLKRFAKIALNQIDSALLKTQQDEKRRICQMEQNKAEKWCKIEIYNEYLKKIPSLLVQIHAVEKMYEKAKLEQQMLTTQPENDSRRQYQARLDSTERQCACRLQGVQGLKAQLEEELWEQLGCK